MIVLDGLLAIYVMNFVVMLSMLLATLYRAWIEKQNLDARSRMEKLKMLLEKERDLFKEMSGEDFIEMLRVILGEN